MKRLIKKIINNLLMPFGYEIIKSSEATDNSGIDSAPSQLLLSLQYRSLAAQGLPLPRVQEAGFRVFSQNDEDGLLLYLFAIMGAKNKIFIEIGSGDGVECNCANLAINFGWHGLLIDGSEQNVAAATKFYQFHPNTRVFPPKIMAAMVRRDNINELLQTAGFTGEIDLLSMDIDGMDYWVWEALEVVNPRLVVIEANGKFGQRSITVPYDPDFVYNPAEFPHYHGASLTALTKLGRRKGYRLVGTNRFGFNAFFVRRDVAPDLLPEVTVESCRTHPCRADDEMIFHKISHLPFSNI